MSPETLDRLPPRRQPLSGRLRAFWPPPCAHLQPDRPDRHDYTAGHLLAPSAGRHRPGEASGDRRAHLGRRAGGPQSWPRRRQPRPRIGDPNVVHIAWVRRTLPTSAACSTIGSLQPCPYGRVNPGRTSCGFQTAITQEAGLLSGCFALHADWHLRTSSKRPC